MIIPDKLKVNRLRQIRIPEKREYFGHYGNQLGMQPITGEDYEPEGRKTEEFKKAEEFDRECRNLPCAALKNHTGG